MDAQQFEEYLPRYRDVIEALARKVARRDHELYDDLVQTGMIELWKLDPARAEENEDAWIRAVLYNKMVSVFRREMRRTVGSLDALLERGAQVSETDAGDISVITPRGGRRRASDYDGPDGEE